MDTPSPRPAGRTIKQGLDHMTVCESLRETQKMCLVENKPEVWIRLAKAWLKGLHVEDSIGHI